MEKVEATPQAQLATHGEIEIGRKIDENQFLRAIPLFLTSYPSMHTRLSYKRSLKEFLQFWEQQGIFISRLTDLQRFHLDAWQRSLEQSPLSPASICAKVSALVSFARFAYENGWIEKNPGEFIKIPVLKNQRGKTEALSENEAKLILEKLEQNYRSAKNPFYKKDDYRAWLHYGIFLTFVTVGMRASELASLRICDLQKSDKFYRLHLNLKGGQEHAPLIPTHLSTFLIEFISTCRKFAGKEDPLFSTATTSNKPIDRSYVSFLMTKIAQESGIETKISSHSLRATLASLLHKNNVPIGEIKDLLGHSSIVTTMRYVRRSDEEKESAALKNPLVNSLNTDKDHLQKG